MKFNEWRDLVPEVIIWEDISQPIEANQSWYDQKELREWLEDGDCLVEQAGYVIYENSEYLVIVSSLLESHEAYSDVNKIPKSMIKKRIKWGENIKE